MIVKTKKWTIREQADFLKKIGELLTRGYPLAEAIHSLTYQMKEKRKMEIVQCLDHLKEGYPFYKVLLSLSFNQTLVGFVYFAEQHGSLAEAFQDGSEMMLKRDHDLHRLKKMVIYPLFLIMVTFFLFVFVEKILLPRYSSLFSSMNLSPNFFMKIIFLAGNLFPVFLLSLFVLFLYILWFYFFKFQRLSPINQRIMLTSLPVIGPFFKLLHTHYFTVQLSYLLGGGLSILEALSLFEEHEKNPFDRQIGKEMKDKLARGMKLEEIVSTYRFFEKELPFIVKHGQQNGKLDQELFFFGKHCLSILEERTERVIKTVQPILYSLIGLIIVSMYLAVLLPMFHLLDGF